MAVLPTLTILGFVTAPDKQLEKLVEYFFKNAYSQSVLFYGTIKSLPYLLRKYNNDEIELTTEVKSELTDLLINYFDTVNVDASIVSTPDLNNTNRVINSLQIWVEVTKDGKTYYLEKNQELDFKTTTPNYTDNILL